MQNMILATPVLSDAAILTGTASSGALGINNLKRMSLKQVYRAASGTAFIQADLLTPQTINLVALMGHSGSQASYARVRGSNDKSFSSGYDSGLVNFRSHQVASFSSFYDPVLLSFPMIDVPGYLVTEDEDRLITEDGFFLIHDVSYEEDIPDRIPLEKSMFMQFFTAQTFRYWRIDIVDPLSLYIDIGRLYISKAFQPKTNIEYGINEGIFDPSRKTRTVSGEVIPLERNKWRFVDFSLGYATKEEMFGEIFPIENMRGTTKDVLFVVDPDEKEHLQYRSYYGTMANQPISNPMYSLFSKTFRIEEII